ncbi:MAG TPA: OmpA family protein [Candidatus Methylomirabilis sp.]|nr:OmpA family protein [Candidatus Methylomirabilis sp.]
MRNWCLAFLLAALLAVPLSAQQHEPSAKDDSATAAAPARGGAGLKTGDITPASRRLFALPEAPQPKPFPADAKSSDETPPGRLVPRYEADAMFNYINFHPGGSFPSFNNYGGSGGFAWNANSWFGLAAEVGAVTFSRTVTVSPVHGSLATFLAGPRLNLRRFDYFVPFAEFLLGAAHSGAPMTGTSGQSAFALAAGGGVDVALTRNIAWRFAQIDYLMTNFSGPSVGGKARQDNLRLGTGIVLRFGLPHPAPPPPPHQPPVAACSANPISVFAGSGDAIAIHVNATSPQNDTLTYSYTATGGAVDGTGPDARWNSTGVAVGTYTVTAKVDDGKGGTASCAADVKVEERPNRPPTATLSVERSPIQPGEHTGITCNGSDPDGDPLTYSYSASGGQVTGTGSNATFDATGLAPGTYTVKCTVNDGRGGTADASGTVEVKEPPQVHELEMRLSLHSIYFPTAQPTVAKPNGGLLASQADTLDKLATDFKQYLTYKPDAHLILGGHTDVRGGQEYNQLLSERRVERTKSYLVEKGVPTDHLETRALGEEENMSEDEMKKLLAEDTELSAADKKKLMANLLTVRLANNRRVDVTLSTTGEQSVRKFPFNAHDALTLLSRRVEGAGTTKAPAAKKPAAKPAPKP